MKAYEVNYGTVVVVLEDVQTPPGSSPVKKGDEITIYKMDGMYCNGVNKDGERIYLAAWTEVEPV
jgi:hypothetical protein